MLYRLPIVLSTVNVSTGRNQPTIGPLQGVLPGITALDRTTINAWEDAEFRELITEAVEVTGRVSGNANHRFTAFNATGVALYQVRLRRRHHRPAQPDAASPMHPPSSRQNYLFCARSRGRSDR